MTLEGTWGHWRPQQGTEDPPRGTLKGTERTWGVAEVTQGGGGTHGDIKDDTTGTFGGAGGQVDPPMGTWRGQGDTKGTRGPGGDTHTPPPGQWGPLGQWQGDPLGTPRDHREGLENPRRGQGDPPPPPPMTWGQEGDKGHGGGFYIPGLFLARGAAFQYEKKKKKGGWEKKKA